MRPECPHPWCRIHVPWRWLSPLRRRWPLWIVLAAGLAFVATRFVEVRQLATALAEGQWQWILAAAILQGVYYTVYAEEFRCGFATVGVASRLRTLLPVLFASMFVGTVTPTGALGSAALLVEDAARRKQSPARAAEGVLLVWVAGLSSSLPVLVLGLAHLQSQRVLLLYAAIASLIFVGYTGLLVGALLAAAWQPARLRSLLDWMQARVNALMARLRRPPVLPAEWAQRNAAEAGGAAVAMMAHPGQVALTVGIALATHLVNLACLGTLFLGFHHALGLGALAAAYALGFVFSVISFIPFDLGVVAGVMTLVYAALGVPTARAALIAIAFRGLNAWLPLGVGFVMFRWILSPGQRGPGKRD